MQLRAGLRPDPRRIPMKWLRYSLLMALCVGVLAPWARGDEPKKTEAPATPSKPLTPPAAKDEPTIPAVKGVTEPQKAGYVARHEGFMKDKAEALAKGPIQFVLLGDSITDGWRGKNGKAIYDEAFGKYNPFNTGIGGDRTQHVLWRIENGELDGLTPNPKVAMLMIGTNNTGPNPSDESI